MGKLATRLAKGRELARTYYYNAPIDPVDDPVAAGEQQKFFSVLGWIPLMEKRMGKLLRREIKYKCPHCGKESISRTHIQKGVDTRICVDLVTLAVRDRYDVGILVSGDADLIEPVRFVKDFHNTRIENAFTLEGWAPELRAEADIKIILDENFLANCWQDKK